MRFRSIPVTIILLSVATIWAQTSVGGQNPSDATPQSQAAPAPSSQDPSVAMQRMEAVHEQRLQEMEVILAKMHTLLNDMKAKVAAGDSKNASSQMDNIELWEMLLGHLDKTLAQARMAAIQRGALAGGSSGKRRGPMVYRRPGADQTLPGYPTVAPPQLQEPPR